MLTWSVILFGVAALGGIIMFAMRARDEMPPLGLALLHGLLAATALVLLAVVVIGGEANALVTSSLAFFVLAALGGFYLLALHLRKGTFPLGLVVAHGGLAVVAFVLLVAAIFL